MQFQSLSGLDRVMFDHFFRGRRDGRFVELGVGLRPSDGSTQTFQSRMAWYGLLVDENPDMLAVAATRRGLPRLHLPRDVDGAGRTALLAAQCAALGWDTVDYLAVDPRLGSRIAAGLDLAALRVRTVSLPMDQAVERVAEELLDRGFEVLREHGDLVVFYAPEARRLPRTTIICPVWHRDPNRAALLQGHRRCLDAQTVPVDRIYVFDGGDRPPEGLPGLTMSVGDPISTSDACNLALSQVATPFVMILSLDDRIGPDAVDTLERALEARDADLALADWRVTYSMDETDAVLPAFDIQVLPTATAWPPVPGSMVRIGSGNPHYEDIEAKLGRCCALGPALFWRMSLHQTFPRWPTRFRDGSEVSKSADGLWLRLLDTRPGGTRVIRVPKVIGNYFSHPETQQEFREADVDDFELAAKVGVALV